MWQALGGLPRSPSHSRSAGAHHRDHLDLAITESESGRTPSLSGGDRGRCGGRLQYAASALPQPRRGPDPATAVLLMVVGRP